jgi:hypothetical protein
MTNGSKGKNMTDDRTGFEMRYGQLYLRPERKDRSAPIGAFRLDGKPKALQVALPVPGMVRQTKGALGYIHGVTVEDEPNQPLSKGRQVPITHGMKNNAERGHLGNAGSIFEAGANPRSCQKHGVEQLCDTAMLPSAMSLGPMVRGMKR